MLSLKKDSPCLPGVYSLAIIDEAPQCDIPPMIPVLYRAQRIAIVGDPDQFPPVITLKKGRDLAFRRKYRLDGPECRKFAHGENNAFGVPPQKAMLLDEHFRCADGIAEYFNSEFYEGSLCLCCETGRTGNSVLNGLKPGMECIDAVGGDEAEIESAIEYLEGLKRSGFTGTIGVISSLRNLANRFKTRAADCKSSLPTQLDISSQVNTANGFQGGEVFLTDRARMDYGTLALCPHPARRQPRFRPLALGQLQRTVIASGVVESETQRSQCARRIWGRGILPRRGLHGFGKVGWFGR